MAPHPCEAIMKSILTDKTFNIKNFFRSGFGEFLTQIIAYFHEFNKEQETGFFKRAKYVDAKSILKCLRSIFGSATASSFKPEHFKDLDEIFCTLLHPNTPVIYRNEAVELYKKLLLLFTDSDIDCLKTSIYFLVPYLNVATREDEIDFQNNLYTKYSPIIDPQHPKPSEKDANDGLNNILEFIFLNWRTNNKLTIDLLFDKILKVIYKMYLNKANIPTHAFGFTKLPETFHHTVIHFFLDLVDKDFDVSPLLATVELSNITITVLSVVTTLNDSDDFITTIRLLSLFVEKQELYSRLVEADPDIVYTILNILASIITINSSNKSCLESPLATVYQEFIGNFLDAAFNRSDTDKNLKLLEKAVLEHEKDLIFTANLAVSTFRWLINQNDTRENVWKVVSNVFVNNKTNAAATSLFAQYLILRALPEIFKIDVNAAKKVGKSFSERNKRNRQTSKYDFIAENTADLFELPAEFVSKRLTQAWPELKDQNKILQRVLIQPVDIKEGEDLVGEIVFFLQQFQFYKNLKFEVQKELAFAPIYTVASLLAKMMLFPPGVKFDGTIPFAICANFLFDAIFNQTNINIAFAAFNELAKILNLNEMKEYLSDKSLSQWYAALILMMGIVEQDKRTKAFQEAQITLQHSFRGSPILQPFMMSLVEERYVPLDSSVFSLLSSFPLLAVQCDLPREFKNSILAIVNKKMGSFNDVKGLIEKPVGNLRERSINLIINFHKKRFANADDAPSWEFLIPTYASFIADEICQPNPNKELIAKFLMFFSDAIKAKRHEAIIEIRSLLIYRTVFAKLIPNDAKKFVTELTNEAILIKPVDDPVWAFEMIRLLGDVYICTSDIMKTGEAYTSFVKFLFTGISNKKDNCYNPEVQDIMKDVLDIFAKQYCRYPSPISPQFMTNTSHVRDNKKHYYTIGGTVAVSSINNETVTIETQFPSGQFVWNFTPIHEKLLEYGNATPISTPITKGSNTKVIPTNETPKQGKFSNMMDSIVDEFQDEFDDNFAFDGIAEDESFNELLEVIDEEYHKMDAVPAENHIAKFPTPPTKFYNLAASVMVSTGRIKIDRFDKLKMMTSEGTALNILEKINTNTTKLGTKFGVIYVKPGSPDQNLILQTQYEDTSAHFHEFITGLGWPVKLESHIGYLGGLDAKNAKNGTTSIYYTDAMHEMMFHISPLIPLDPSNEQQIYKKRHIGNDHVHIVWCAGNTDYNTSTITSQFNNVHIVIYPLQTALFRVDVFWANDVKWFGPLRQSSIVTKQVLPSLVRETAENAMIVFYQDKSAFAHPVTDIRNHIQNISTNYVVSAAKSYSSMIDLMTLN